MRTITTIRARMDHNSRAPKYFVLAEALREAIAEGEIATRSYLGNELEISAGLSVSRPTLRRALAILADRGLIVRRRGSGSVVLGNTIRRNIALTSLYEDLSATEGAPTTRVLTYEAREPDAETRAMFRLSPGETLTFIRRLRFSNGVPIAVMENHVLVPLSTTSPEELERSSLYRILSAHGQAVQVAVQTMGARLASTEEAELLEMERPASVLIIERRSYNQSGEPVELARHGFNAELYSFTMNLVRDA